MMMKHLLVAFLCWVGAGVAGAQGAEDNTLDVSGRHVVFIHSGVDEVVGSYMFLINNRGQATQTSLRLMLPEETVDWMPQEGIGPDELRPGSEGGLVLTKTFPPGETMISLGFRVPAETSVAQLTFRPLYTIGSLAIFSRAGTLDLGPERDGWQYRENIAFAGFHYDTLTRGVVGAGESLTVEIRGVQEGRRRLWILGFVSIAALGGMAAFMTVRTRPRVNRDTPLIT